MIQSIQNPLVRRAIIVASYVPCWVLLFSAATLDAIALVTGELNELVRRAWRGPR